MGPVEGLVGELENSMGRRNTSRMEGGALTTV